MKIQKSFFKKLIAVLTFLPITSHAKPLYWLLDGTYGSNTNYCGLDIIHDPRSSDENNNEALIAIATSNPFILRHTCVGQGSVLTYKYNPHHGYYRYDNITDKYCIISFSSRPITSITITTSFTQTCFRYTDNSLVSSVVYQLGKSRY